MLNSNFNKIRVSFNSQTTIGNDVFSRFNGAVFKAFSDAPQLSNSEIQGLMLQNSFFKNSIIEYIDLVVVILNYIDKKGGTKKEDFLTILLSQLSEQQKASFAILKHNQLLDFFDFKQKAFLDTPVDAYIKLGEKMSAFKFEN
ncbi:MAG: hypothetical protein R8N23_13315 [Reichenbachiella sp.]|uniref:hypothetical protein n=1 Tax=Reichenbachiella sp. TaxID=2184521 RepID=UPI0029673F77|nr:hypothetical protein [Reichenbachiella sp.]MDW3210849.1 hypothetical protein [Reichenbachiella sp.]